MTFHLLSSRLDVARFVAYNFVSLMPRRLLAALTLFVAAPLLSDPVDAERSFSVEIRPLLAQKCFVCHGSSGVKLGELDLTSRDAMLAGGASGNTVLYPGDAAKSLLYSAVTWEDADLQMPPKANDRLSERQASLIRDWIDAGAPWPDEATQKRYVEQALEQGDAADGARVATSGGLSDDWTNRGYKPEDLWAYQPIRDVPLLDVDASNPVDAFHRARLRAADLTPAPKASKRTTTRRPTPAIRTRSRRATSGESIAFPARLSTRRRPIPRTTSSSNSRPRPTSRTRSGCAAGA